jgi:hypothetical protein
VGLFVSLQVGIIYCNDTYDPIYDIHLLIQAHQRAAGAGYVFATGEGGGVAGKKAGTGGRVVSEGEQTAIYEKPQQ